MGRSHLGAWWCWALSSWHEAIRRMFLPEDKGKLFLTKWVPETGRSSCFCCILLHNPSPCLVLKQNLEWNRNEIFYLTTIMSLRESIPDPVLTMLVTVLREDVARISLVGGSYPYTGKGLVRLNVSPEVTWLEAGGSIGVWISSLAAQRNHPESYEKSL